MKQKKLKKNNENIILNLFIDYNNKYRINIYESSSN